LYADASETSAGVSSHGPGIELQNEPPVLDKIHPIFENILSAKDYGVKKSDSIAYTLIAKKINRLPEEILYIDDNTGNIDAAKDAGLKAILYETNKDLFSELAGYIT